MKTTIKIILLLITMTSYSQAYEIKVDTIILLKDGYNVSIDTNIWVSIDTINLDIDKSDTTYIDFIEAGLNSIDNYNEYIDSILIELELLKVNNNRWAESLKSNIKSNIDSNAKELDKQYRAFIERHNIPKLDSVPSYIIDRHHYPKVSPPDVVIESTMFERYSTLIIIIVFAVIAAIIGFLIFKS